MPTAALAYRLPRYVKGLFFGALLLLGAALFADYGVPWDEPTDRLNGLVSLRYLADLVAPGWASHQAVLQAVPPLATYHDRDYGVLFQLPLALVEAGWPGADLRTIYLLRHAAVFLTCLGGIWALFQLATLRFRDERLGLLAAGLFVLSPRFFGESFYNGKDLVFTAAFTLGAYTLARLLERPTWRRALLHGLATAAAVDLRILGLLLVPITGALLAFSYFGAGGRQPRGQQALVQAGLAYGPATAVGTVLGWPYLWTHPLGHLREAFHNMKHFRWPGEVLYAGHLIPGVRLPWHYAPVWISITTPVAYQLAALVGLGLVATELVRRPLAVAFSYQGQLDLLLAGWLVLPIGLVIGLHSVIYDGWRHLYFVYPALLLLAVRGGVALAQLGQRGAGWRQLARGLGLLAGAEALFTAGRMVAMHPFEQTYFSYLPARQVEQQFERDYWGLVFRQGLEYLVARQPTGPIAFDVPPLPQLDPRGTWLVDHNKAWLTPADRARLVLAPDAPGRYYLAFYRLHPQPYPASVGQEVYAVRANGVKLLSIFQRPPNAPVQR